MKHQLETDLCEHLRARLRRAFEDHMDTCARAEVSADNAFDMAIATLIAEALTVAKASGSSADDVMQIITFVKQKAIAP